MNLSPKMAKAKWLILPVVAVFAGVAVLATNNPGIEAQTSPENVDARLKTRRYNASLQDVRKTVLEIIPQLRKYGGHWRLAETQTENEVRAEVPVLVFVDDLAVELREENGETFVDVFSKSRFPGRSDLGENRRHILQVLAALDEKFGQVEN